MNTLKAATNPIFFEPAASSEDTTEGEPWYVSGAHMWNGTRAILNPRPAIIKTTANKPIGLPSSKLMFSATPGILVVPVAPYMNDIPKSIKAADNDPIMKYFIEASSETGFFFSKPAKAYVARLASSKATNKTIRSLADATNIIPAVAKIIRE